ncbi:hypothetical protein chiPu_0014899 [Chiloscyllium punctatum]|uniref:TNF family profile domain-containing protein n=1 Tax=Chiloscyllium punctatum TaxID=137246 RepID=A0A401T197_CHIPU|nr:hypothetical protein [Chiloscyllium punctatum]
MTGTAARGVAINPQRRSFPLAIFNGLLTVICLATAALLLCKLPQPAPIDVKSTLFVIHAKVDGTSEGKVKLNSKSSWVRNNTIVVPCDGIYLVYAHISSQNNSAPSLKIMKKGTPDSVETWHLVDAKESSPMAMSELRINESIYMTLELSSETFDQAESYLGIALLEVLQNVKSCRQLLSRKS